jgi:uncharacterized RDD family membrane protein YckC
MPCEHQRVATPDPRPSPVGSAGLDPTAVVPRRIAAALLDALLLWAALLAVYAVSGPHGNVSLGPRASLVFSLIGLAYYFAGEAATGQTPGKHLLGLQVVRTDGRRAQPGRIAVRTLFRLVDELPVLYGLGFVVMLSTARRQRLGDMFADTIVVRRRPRR